jgi:hypothetical protein
MKQSQLHQLIKEELNRYMFFQNLKSIKMMVDEMLELDENSIDSILADGHDWADDHIATSKDDIEEVHNFLMVNNSSSTNLNEEEVEVEVPDDVYDDLIKNGFTSLSDLFKSSMKKNKDSLSFKTKEWIQTVLKPKYIYSKK